MDELRQGDDVIPNLIPSTVLQAYGVDLGPPPATPPPLPPVQPPSPPPIDDSLIPPSPAPPPEPEFQRPPPPKRKIWPPPAPIGSFVSHQPHHWKMYRPRKHGVFNLNVVLTVAIAVGAVVPAAVIVSRRSTANANPGYYDYPVDRD